MGDVLNSVAVFLEVAAIASLLHAAHTHRDKALGSILAAMGCVMFSAANPLGA